MIDIIGIVLVKNEDVWVELAVLNILDFCDKIIIVDNYSTDNTFNILEEITKGVNKITLLQGTQLDSSASIHGYIGKKCWVFGVDGDEIYDPFGLSLLKQEILNGDFEKNTRIMGNCFHCSEVNLVTKKAKGHGCPPSRNVCKLFNFEVIESWGGHLKNERLHGERMVISRHAKGQCFSDNLNLLHMHHTERSSTDRRSILNKKFQEGGIDLLEFRTHWPQMATQRRLKRVKEYSKGQLLTKNIDCFF